MPALDPLAPFRLDGRVAVVTGASSGLGARMARVLASAGASVVLAARRVDRLDALAAELPGSMPLQCDVTDDADCDRLVARTVERFGRLDVLVNNAGATDPVPAEQLDRAEFRRMVALNLTAPFVLSQAAAAHMLDGHGGSIVNVASIYGLVGVGSIPSTGYAAAKAGLIGLTRELSAQWCRRGVRVNALAPGWFRSEITDAMFDDERTMAWVRRATPLGRPGAEGELDSAVLFLSSPASAFVTGQVLAVDGGWTSV